MITQRRDQEGQRWFGGQPHDFGEVAVGERISFSSVPIFLMPFLERWMREALLSWEGEPHLEGEEVLDASPSSLRSSLHTSLHSSSRFSTAPPSPASASSDMERTAEGVALLVYLGQS